MKVRIKTNDKKLLNYETPGACAFDFKCIEDIIFEVWEFKLVDTWTVIEVPKGYMLQIQPRSSTFKKHGLIQVNSVWIIDQDYCWDNDTIKFAYMNLSKERQKLEAGTRIWQWVFVKIEKVEFVLIDNMENRDRGWFGTTWLK